MKKTLLLAGVVGTMFAFNANAMNVRPYVEGKISQSWLKAEYKEDGFGKENFKDNVFGGSIEFGAKLNQFRIGLEGYYNDDMKDSLLNVVPVKAETKGAFLNAYYDLPLSVKQIKPYVGVGVGYSWLKETADMTGLGFGEATGKDKDLGWQLGFGIAYELNNNVDLTLGYRYEDLGEIKYSDNQTDFTNHKVSLGLRYNF